MKKAAVLAVIALPLVAYTGGAWYLGQRIQNSHDNQAKQVEGIPNVKLVKRDYQRGLFSSTETVTIELMGDTARALQPGLALKVSQIDPVPTSAYPTPARRPLNSRLDTRRLQDTFGLHLPHWETGVRRMLGEVLGAP